MDKDLRGGFRSGSFNVITGRSGGYKTTLLWKMALCALQQGRKILYLSRDRREPVGDRARRDIEGRGYPGKLFYVNGPIQQGLQHVEGWGGCPFEAVFVDDFEPDADAAPGFMGSMVRTAQRLARNHGVPFVITVRSLGMQPVATLSGIAYTDSLAMGADIVMTPVKDGTGDLAVRVLKCRYLKPNGYTLSEWYF